MYYHEKHVDVGSNFPLLWLQCLIGAWGPLQRYHASIDIGALEWVYSSAWAVRYHRHITRTWVVDRRGVSKLGYGRAAVYVSAGDVSAQVIAVTCCRAELGESYPGFAYTNRSLSHRVPTCSDGNEIVAWVSRIYECLVLFFLLLFLLFFLSTFPNNYCSTIDLHVCCFASCFEPVTKVITLFLPRFPRSFRRVSSS